MVLINEIMNDKIFMISEDSFVFEALDKMKKKDVNYLIIKDDDDKVKGIITRKDIFEKVTVPGKDHKSVKVCDVMNTPVTTIEDHHNVIIAAGMMRKNNIKQIPVIKGQKVVGIVKQHEIIEIINKTAGMDIPNI